MVLPPAPPPQMHLYCDKQKNKNWQVFCSMQQTAAAAQLGPTTHGNAMQYFYLKKVKTQFISVPTNSVLDSTRWFGAKLVFFFKEEAASRSDMTTPSTASSRHLG